MAGPIRIAILSNASQANREINGFTNNAEKKMGRVGKAGKMVGGLFAGAAAAGMVKFGVDSVKSLGRIERINAQTTSTIKATGGAAGVSAGHVENLTGKLEGLTATEAESVQEGANMLLTFKGIRNEAGKGNDVFDQSVATLTDMSRAMGSEPKKAAIQLGKALNDPIKGVSALSKVGVTFNDEQKKMIEGFVKSGDTASAQKVILKELSSEFGGAGEAFAKTTEGKIALAEHSLGTLGETIMAGTLPAIGDLATKAEGLFAFLDKNPAVVKVLAGVIGVTLVGAFVAWTASVWAANVALLANPVTWIVLGIVALIAVIILLAKNFDKVKEVAGKAWDWIKNKTSAAWGAVKAKFSEIWSGMVETARGHGEKVIGWAKSIPEKIKGAFNGAKEWLKDAGGNVVDGLLRGLSGGAKTIGSWFLDKVPGWIKTPFKKALGIESPSKVFAGYGTNIVDGLRGGIAREKVALRRTMADVDGVLTGRRYGDALDVVATARQAPAPVSVRVEVAPTADLYSVGREVEKALRAYNGIGAPR